MGFFIETVPYESAADDLKAFYDQDLKDLGVVASTTKSFSLFPDTFRGWRELLGSIRKHIRLRHYELTTFAAAQALGCTYCMLAHGSILKKNGFTPAQLEALARDFHQAGLEPKEVAMMDYAQKVIRDASSTTAEDFVELRRLGWTDEDILAITLATTARAFASKLFDALGAPPDSIYRELDEETHHALIGKRPFSG